MTLLLYAIADGAPGPIDGQGLEGRPLRAVGDKSLVEVGDKSLVAVVSEHERLATSSNEESLWEYERVIESLMERWAVLPARFGSRFDGEPELRTMVRDRQEQLARALDLVNGAVELSVTATWADGGAAGPPPDRSSGTDYMMGRLAQHRRASEIASQLQPLAALARACTERLLVTDSLPLVAAYLVERAAVEDFAALVRELDGQLETANLVCTGPWPPYSFTGESGS